MATSETTAVRVPRRKVAEFCRRHSIRKLALFGSVLHPTEFTDQSDIDILVEFAPDHIPGFFRLGKMEEELSRLFDHHKIDLVTIGFLHPRIKDSVLKEARTLYAQR